MTLIASAGLILAVLYIRQSRHKKYERTVSPEVQEAELRALPAVAAADVVEVFSDLDVSGGKRGRAGYLAFIERIRTGNPDVVAVYDQSRSFRNMADALEFFALLEARPQVRVEFVHGRFDRSPVGEFSYTALAAAHVMERRMTGEKIRDAKRYAAARGAMVGAVPAGYLRRGDEVLIDEEVAPLIRRLFTEYASGRYSTRQLARRLNAEGAVPPSFSSGGWRADTVAQTLANPAYRGLTYVNRRFREGDPLAAPWPALVDEEMWERVRARLGRVPGRGGRKFRRYTFQGLLVCQCGARLHAHHMHGVDRYYCRRTDDADPCPGGRSVRDDALVPQARAIFAGLEALKPPDFDQAKGQTEPLAPPSTDALAMIDRKLERCERLYVMGHWVEERYLAERQPLEALRAELEARSAEPAAPRLQLHGVLDAWDAGDAHGRRELLSQLFAGLHVHEGRIVGYSPRAEVAAEVAELMQRVSTSSPGGIRADGSEPLRLVV